MLELPAKSVKNANDRQTKSEDDFQISFKMLQVLVRQFETYLRLAE